VAAGLAIATGSEPAATFAALAQLKGAKGRLELVGENNDAPIFVDYAHKPDALAKALQALRPYATLRLVVINKDMSRDASVTISNLGGAEPASVMRLNAPSLTANTAITLGGASVGNGGKWRGGKSEPVKPAGGKALLDVPAGSAALVTFSAPPAPRWSP